MASTLFFRVVVILIWKWPKKIRVLQLDANDKLLLTNGILIITWKCKNLLWIKIDGIATTTNSRGILFHYEKVSTSLNITFYGLFGKTTRIFVLKKKQRLVSENLYAPTFPGISSLESIKGVIVFEGLSDVESRLNKIPASTGPTISPIKLNIPPFKPNQS